MSDVPPLGLVCNEGTNAFLADGHLAHPTQPAHTARQPARQSFTERTVTG